MKTNTSMTADEIAMAEQYITAAREQIKMGTLAVGGVTIKALHRGNVMRVFTPGVAELVRRYLRGW